MSTAPSDLKSVEVNGHSISYDDHGPATGPAVVLLSGWCQDHRLFDPLLPHLTDTHRVIRIDWRGHGTDRTPVADFGYPEQADDTIAVLDHLGVDTFLPVSTSHGGWANIELTDRLGARRVPRSIVIDWIMTPPPEDFADGLAAIQDPERWTEGRQGLFDTWLNGSSNPVVRHHLDKEMADFDFEMWARSCRVIAAGYERWGTPLLRMNALADKRPVRHLFSQPTDAGYVRAQRDFGAEHPWFSYRQIGGETHFPTLDSPGSVAEQIRGFGSGDDAAAG
ncbi:alpha/beta fold hydrolase [Streptomyces sp. DT24]|uniref:alpha/beta hydrolase n=1 Tax=unclassified Streptomyces TaxID=2593676 RepID=UPI0023B8DF5D|nr:alpha/beta hydrolase [Streptomyces sp. AM 4-1-1]WEH37029.1 alpha/beta hydrolase [Streptomyces sp. AM 4-1-1]